MVEVYNHTGVLAPEDRLEDCAPWLHELGWRPQGWVFAAKAEPLGNYAGLGQVAVPGSYGGAVPEVIGRSSIQRY